jgi:hypothetical protein
MFFYKNVCGYGGSVNQDTVGHRKEFLPGLPQGYKPKKIFLMVMKQDCLTVYFTEEH